MYWIVFLYCCRLSTGNGSDVKIHGAYIDPLSSYHAYACACPEASCLLVALATFTRKLTYVWTALAQDVGQLRPTGAMTSYCRIGKTTSASGKVRNNWHVIGWWAWHLVVVVVVVVVRARSRSMGWVFDVDLSVSASPYSLRFNVRKLTECAMLLRTAHANILFLLPQRLRLLDGLRALFTPFWKSHSDISCFLQLQPIVT
jgi:hypothetical protein